jgi:hypothetical protein
MEVAFLIVAGKIKMQNGVFFFLKITNLLKLASRLIKNLPVPFGTLVRKRVRLELAAKHQDSITTLFKTARSSKASKATCLGGSSSQVIIISS